MYKIKSEWKGGVGDCQYNQRQPRYYKIYT